MSKESQNHIPNMPQLPKEVVQRIINYLTSNMDRNSVSLVNKLWYTVDSNSRKAVYVSKCDAISPERVITRFPNLCSLTLKGKHENSVSPWIEALSKDCPLLEKLTLKRMFVSDESLDMISIRFKRFKSLVLNSCNGFTIVGLSAIASNCSFLEQLEVERCGAKDNNGQFLTSFPETLSSLVTLNMSCIKGVVDPTELERLVARSPNLTTLLLSNSVHVNTIQRILTKSSQLAHLGVGPIIPNLNVSPLFRISLSLDNYESIKSLTFFTMFPTTSIHVFYPLCPNLVYVNMRSVVVIDSCELVNFIRKCSNLRCLVVQEYIGDEGLKVISNSCKSLEKLKVFYEKGINGVTEVGLTAISTGCQKLISLTYCCIRMTNLALEVFSKNCPNVSSFKLIIPTPRQPDHTTFQPFDHGYRAIVQSCKNVKKLNLSGLLTDDVFLYIGMYAERLEVLSLSSGGENDEGMKYVFNGCKNLRKVDIRDSPFNDDPFLEHIYPD